jgi:TrmH family RNA methyltransferase
MSNLKYKTIGMINPRGLPRVYFSCHKEDFEKYFEQLSDEKSPEGVICVAEYLENKHREVSSEGLSADSDSKILLLESLRDPQNVGAVIRVAAAFGVDKIIMSRDCADIYSPKTLRAAMGTVFDVRIDRVDDLPLAVEKLRGYGRRVFAAALDRDSVKLGELEMKSGDCVVIGNEGHGLTNETVSACNGTVFIPMSDGVESLNAATAAAVLVWEFFGLGKDKR